MYLLDTNVVSELRKVRTERADPNVVVWARSAPGARLFLSVIVVRELEIGTLLAERRDATKGALLRAWLDRYVIPSFAERILPIDIMIARRSAGLHVPNPRAIRGALIAATALVHGMTVVTRNVSDFEPMGVQVLNPWQHPRPVDT